MRTRREHLQLRTLPDRRFLIAVALRGGMAASGQAAAPPAAPAVEFLSAAQVAESDGTASFTNMSGTYTPHADATFVLGIQHYRNGSTAVAGSAMSLNGVSMGAAISSDDGLGSNRTYLMAFGLASPTAGTLAYTRTAGTALCGQLWGVSFRHVASVGTPVKAADAAGASPATVNITPVAAGDMIVVFANIENLPAADGELTPSNCTERLDLVSPRGTASERTIGGLGTLLAPSTAAQTVGFSFGGTPDQWTCHAILLRKAA